MPPGTLILLRHGESAYNAARIFTGLLDVPLTTRGEQQARAAGALLREHGLVPDVVLTSPMRRALETTRIAVVEGGFDHVPVTATWRLAERDYGSLTGVPKAEARERYGPEGYLTVRRTLDGAPPPATPEQAATWGKAYEEPGSGLPAPGSAETLRDVIARVTPLWHEARGLVSSGRAVLVVGHGNSLRALCALVDDLTGQEVEDLNLPPGQPQVRTWDGAGLVPRGGRYLDPVDAHRAAEQIAREGGT